MASVAMHKFAQDTDAHQGKRKHDECTSDDSVSTEASATVKSLKQSAQRLDVLVPPVRYSPKERAVLGVLQIGTDHNHDHEGAVLINAFKGVGVRMAKIVLPDENICADTYERAFANGEVQRGVDSIRLPADYVTHWGVACTSLSFILGEKLTKIVPKPCFTMWEAVQAALATVRGNSVLRLAVLTPYIKDVHDKNVKLLQGLEDIDVVKDHGLGLPIDRLTSAVDPEYLAECVAALAEGCDCVFIGCGGFRVCTPGYISKLEEKVKVPIVTSTQAFYWHVLRSAGIRDAVDGYGLLFHDH